MKKLALLVLVILLGTAFPAYQSQCDIEYQQCMVSCCSKCNAQVGMDADSRYVCQIRISNELDQGCMNTCGYCYDNYSSCVVSDAQGDNVNLSNLGQPLLPNGSPQGGAAPNPSGSKPGGVCGLPLVLLGFAAFAALAKK